MKRILAIAGLWLASILPSSAAVFILQAPVAQTGAVPAVTTDGTPEAYIGNGPAIILENTLGITCTCSTLSSATVTISSGAFSGDVLAAPTQVGITAGFTSNTLTLTGTAAISTYLSVLQNVTYSSSNADPTNSGSNLTRTITWNVVNGSNASNSPTTTVNVTAGTPPPTLTPSGSVATFTSSGSPVALDGGITLTCSCSTLTSASLVISSGLLSGDVLNTVTPGSLTSGYDAPSGTLTLTGTATLAVYQTAFRSITYSSTLTDPTNGGADPTRAVTWTANNSTSAGAASTTVNVQNPSVPTITVAAGNQINYTGGGSPLALDASIGVTCTCVNLTSATITLSSGFFTGDVFAATTSLGITTVYNSSTGVMTFTGNTTVANYQTLLRTLTYSSSSGDPSNGGLNPRRTATWVAFNGANASQPATTAINVFIAGQPSWAMTGAQVALNPATDQAWVNGLGTGPMSAEITVTRPVTETCYGGAAPNYVTYAPPNTECATPTGLAAWPPYTNYLPFSNDASNTAAWNSYCGATCPANGSTVTITGNSVLDPTGVTSHASKIAISRTSTGQFAAVINNEANSPSGLYSAGFWIQADTPGDVGKVVQFGFLSSAGFSVHNLTLPATWTWFPYYQLANITSGCSAATQSCQFQIGLTNQPGNGTANSTLAATFDIWGGELNPGVYAFPSVPTLSSPGAGGGDNIAIASGSALETALTGVASSVIMNSNLGVQGVASTLLDTNGITLLGEASDNTLVTNLGFTAKTSNIGAWNLPTVEGFARDGSGRSMALNNLIVYTDSQATIPGKPLYLGSTLGTQNFFSGYLGVLNAFNTRVPNSQLGVSGVGSNYYFAAAGNDSNACTIGSPCQSITKAQSIGLVTNDTLNFNGGDTFVGCLVETGGVNWNATRTAPATITSYGTGQAILTGNCANGPLSPRNAILTLRNTDGVVVNNLEFLGDSAGTDNIGILITNSNDGITHGNITIQNNFCTGLHEPASDVFEGACIFRYQAGSNPVNNMKILNNTDSGATAGSHDNNFMWSFGNTCQSQWDAIQGNLIFNLGGTLGTAGGTGVYTSGGCGVGSTAGGTLPGAASGLPSAIVQFSVVHDNGTNLNACGNYYGIWGVAQTDTIYRMNEVYNSHAVGGCDAGGFDVDGGGGQPAYNGLIERNYCHNNFGPCVLNFATANNVTTRWNISDGDGVGTGTGNQNQPAFQGVGGTLSYIYNNVFVGYAGVSGQTGAVISFNGCPATGSLFANNIVIARFSSSVQNFFRINVQNSTTVCSPPPTGGLSVANNNWWSTHAGSFNRTGWIDGQGNTNGTMTASISGTTMTITAESGTIHANFLVTGAGVPTSTYMLTCTAPSPCTGVPQTWIVSKSATVASESMTAVGAVNGTYATFASLFGESGGLSVDPLFVSPYAQTVCGNTSAGPQASNCPAGMKLQSGSSMHAPAGAVLTSQPFNLPTNNGGGTNNPTHGQGTLDYWGTALPCPTTGGFPIGAQC